MAAPRQARTLSLTRLAEEVMKLAKNDPNRKKPFSTALTSAARDAITDQVSTAACHFSLTGMQLLREVKSLGSRDLMKEANKIVGSIDSCFSTLFQSCSMIIQKPSDLSHRTAAVGAMFEVMVWIKELANLALLMDKIKIEKQLRKVQKQLTKLGENPQPQQLAQFHKQHQRAMELYSQFTTATDTLTSRHGTDQTAASSVISIVLKWSQQLVQILITASSGMLLEWNIASSNSSVTAYTGGGKSSVLEPIMNQLSATLDRLAALLGQEDDTHDSPKKSPKKPVAPAGVLSNALAAFELLAAKEPPNVNRAKLEAHIASLRRQCNTILQHSGACIDIRNHDNIHQHGNHDGNELMTARQTKAEIAVETVTLANNTLLSAVSDLPSNNTPRDLATLKYFDDSLNRLLPAVASLRRRLMRVCAEHYVSVLAHFDPAVFDMLPSDSSQDHGRTRTMSDSISPPGEVSRDQLVVSPIDSVSSVSLNMPSPSPTWDSKTPSPASPLCVPRHAGVDDVYREIDCTLESDFLKYKSRMLDQHQHIRQMCRSMSLLARSQSQCDIAHLLQGKLQCLTDVFLACCDCRRSCTKRTEQIGLDSLLQMCIDALWSVYEEACTLVCTDVPLLDVITIIDLRLSDSLEASRTFSLLGSTDALNKVLSNSCNLASFLLLLLKQRIAELKSAKNQRRTPGSRQSAARVPQDDQLEDIVKCLEMKVLPDMLHVTATASRTSRLRDDISRVAREVTAFLNDLHLSSRQLKLRSGWNQVEADNSDEERELSKDDDMPTAGLLHTIPETSQDDPQGALHSRLLNLSTIAEESEGSEEDNDFGLKRSQSLSRRSSLRASCRLLSLSSTSSLSEENEIVTTLFQDWRWARSHIQAVASELFQAIDHALAIFSKARRRGSGSDLSKLIKLCQIQWEDINEQCLVRLKEVLGDSLPQKLVALYANTSLLCHQLSSFADKDAESAGTRGESSGLAENETKLLQQNLTDLKHSAVDTLTATRRHTNIRKSRSKQRPEVEKEKPLSADSGKPGLVLQTQQEEYFI
ncbi:uncharacterized protein LOC135808940 [Sycon ciliatum]|uniref:uncharacterized protein LOC135808940 n=1 Tax=Sycon ciliatum TaxID=27933 RepID=UPI0031F64C18